jgi:hypothetical protein
MKLLNYKRGKHSDDALKIYSFVNILDLPSDSQDEQGKSIY